MRLFLAAAFVIFSSSTFAQVLAINVYQPLPGKGQLSAQYMREAREIQQALGARVSFSVDLKGIYRYNLLFDSWEDYGTFVQSLAANPDWQTFNRKRAMAPASTQIDNLLLN
jgi:hypothetical protein